MFNFNELRFIDDLITEYLKYHQNLPLNIRNHILRLDNKVLEMQKQIKENIEREIEEDYQYIKKISS